MYTLLRREGDTGAGTRALGNGGREAGHASCSPWENSAGQSGAHAQWSRAAAEGASVHLVPGKIR